ncbi:MAG: hypothetical protein KBA51_04335 [Kiritimatiellae bacterium]|nr:hypothetical protein [Kiritimatiellia bacterium]
MASHQIQTERQSRRRWIRRAAVAGVMVFLLSPYLLYRPPPPPDGFNVRSPPRRIPEDRIRLLTDSTAYDARRGERVFDQRIFDAVLDMIRSAQRAVYLDFFLWNSWTGSIPERHRNLSGELADALIRKKAESPDLPILVFTDPINRVYGQEENDFYEAMRAAGICVVFTRMDRLPDPNRLYAAPASVYGPVLSRIPGLRQWLSRRSLPHPLETKGRKVTARHYGRLLFFKANHRKLAIADGPGGWRALVTSFNPADGSSSHSNLGLLMDGSIARDALALELDCVAWSAASPDHVLEPTPGACAQVMDALRNLLKEPREPEPAVGAWAEWLTEESIARKAETMLNNCGRGDTVRLAMFYLSDRPLIAALERADERGADIRIILDANRDAFGRTKNGIPNRPIAAMLMARSERTGGRIGIRWADTHGEQFHPKALSIVRSGGGTAELLCGSANWTRRNVRNFNLEANVYLGDAHEISAEYAAWFDRCWNNSDGLSRTLPYEAFAVSGFERGWKAVLGHWLESTGLSTF